mmetsp:Transcript_13376/g.35069  ORF Transcript_13376/g.35069 Transcript_13376/m.35069 type:complete len:215 (+) Transcript_13376:940-1584(+)
MPPPATGAEISWVRMAGVTRLVKIMVLELKLRTESVAAWYSYSRMSCPLSAGVSIANASDSCVIRSLSHSTPGAAGVYGSVVNHVSTDQSDQPRAFLAFICTRYCLAGRRAVKLYASVPGANSVTSPEKLTARVSMGSWLSYGSSHSAKMFHGCLGCSPRLPLIWVGGVGWSGRPVVCGGMPDELHEGVEWSDAGQNCDEQTQAGSEVPRALHA